MSWSSVPDASRTSATAPKGSTGQGRGELAEDGPGGDRPEVVEEEGVADEVVTCGEDGGHAGAPGHGAVQRQQRGRPYAEGELVQRG